MYFAIDLVTFAVLHPTNLVEQCIHFHKSKVDELFELDEGCSEASKAI